MGIIDFVIGVALVNAIPHVIAGFWGLRMAGGFGYGDTQNLLWAIFNVCVSGGLFVYQYGFSGLIDNKIYLGAFVVVVVFLATGRMQYRYYQKGK